MPFTTDSIPDQVNVLPSAAKTLWLAAANAWIASHPSDDTGAVQLGWGAVNKLFHKVNNKWIKKVKGGE